MLLRARSWRGCARYRQPHAGAWHVAGAAALRMTQLCRFKIVPLFLPADYTTHLRRLKQEHSAELSALLKPLEQLSLSEREAVGAAGIAQAAALAWEANEDVLAALLPRTVQRTLALPAPGVADWILPQPADGGAGTYDSAQQAVKHTSLYVYACLACSLALGCHVRTQQATGLSESSRRQRSRASLPLRQATQLLAHLARDWSADGATAR